MTPDLFSLEGAVAVVTGGGRGLGEEFCLAFARAGAHVVVAELDGETAERTAQKVRDMGGRAVACETDVRRRDSVRSMVERSISELGKIDILMNNAGICIWSPSESMTDQEWGDVIDVNLTGVFLCCQEVGRHMIEQRSGRIINIASMSGLIVNRPQPQVSYNVSKAGVIMLTKSLAAEWTKFNIRVNAIAPGYIATKMTQQYLDQPEYHEEWTGLTPMGRAGQPEELGPLAVYLASEASGYVTGSVVVIDGGYTVW